MVLQHTVQQFIVIMIVTIQHVTPGIGLYKSKSNTSAILICTPFNWKINHLKFVLLKWPQVVLHYFFLHFVSFPFVFSKKEGGGFDLQGAVVFATFIQERPVRHNTDANQTAITRHSNSNRDRQVELRDGSLSSEFCIMNNPLL